MTSLKRLILAGSLMVVVLPTSSVLSQTSPNLEMSGARLQLGQPIRFNPRLTASRSGRDEDDYPPGEPRLPSGMQEKVLYPGKRFAEAQVVAHNTDARTIKAVDWEYTVFRDPKRTEVLETYRIHSRKKIRPGEKKELRGKVESNITAPSTYEKVRPVRIEYTDGTVWEAQ